MNIRSKVKVSVNVRRSSVGRELCTLSSAKPLVIIIIIIIIIVITIFFVKTLC